MNAELEALKEELTLWRMLLGLLLVTGTGLIGWIFTNPGHSLFVMGMWILGCMMAGIRYLFREIGNGIEKIRTLQPQKGEEP